MRYRARPVEIEAFQYWASNVHEIKNVFPDIHLDWNTMAELRVWDYLQHTWVLVNFKDYIIKGTKGEYYPCAADVFERKYEPV